MLLCLNFVAIIATLFYNAYDQGTIDKLSVNPQWCRAYEWIDENTSDDARIVCFADRGYMVLGMTDRYPVYFGNPNDGAEKLAGIYAATSEGELMKALQETGGDYFVYSRADYEGQIVKELNRFLDADMDIRRCCLYKIKDRGNIVYDRDDIVILKQAPDPPDSPDTDQSGNHVGLKL